MSKTRTRQVERAPKARIAEKPAASPVIEKEVIAVPVVPAVVSEDSIQVYRRCPICWGRAKGYGVTYSTHGRTRYYKCVKSISQELPPCGHTWSATVKLEVLKVEHRTVLIDGER